jgi:hypothetical protein
MLERAKEKAELIGKVHGLRGSEMGNAIIDYLDFLIDEVRMENDNATTEEVRFNQGRLSVLKALYSDITKGLPVRG